MYARGLMLRTTLNEWMNEWRKLTFMESVLCQSLSCILQVLPHIILIIPLWDSYNCYYSNFTDEETEVHRVHTAKKRYSQHLCPSLSQSKAPALSLPSSAAITQQAHKHVYHDCPEKLWTVQGEGHDSFSILPAGSSLDGDPNGKMLLAIRSIQPFESLVSNVYPLVTLCPWSAVSVHWEHSHLVWDPQQLWSPGAHKVGRVTRSSNSSRHTMGEDIGLLPM